MTDPTNDAGQGLTDAEIAAQLVEKLNVFHQLLHRPIINANDRVAIQQDVQQAIVLLGRSVAAGWLPIATRPKDEDEPFLVRTPKNDMADYVVLQVSVFEGQMHPDWLNGAIDYRDAVTTATHWMPRPAKKTEGNQ